MKETARTMAFVIAAGISAAAAFSAHWLTRPAEVSGFEKVGTEFYPEFKDAGAAQALRVVGYNEDTATIPEFEVKYDKGVWRIPSRHNYPADARDRLAKTAASVIGIQREALASRRDADHERYGVLDPLDADGTKLKGRGQRITLSDAKGKALADYIIGKQVEDREGYYYIRSPSEKETYLAKLQIDLSTKFADWIEPDLLKLDRDKLVEIVVDKYSIDESAGEITGKEISTLTRATSSDPWELDGLDEDTEEVNTDATREIVSSLDDLKIVGVRPKPQGITSDLRVDRKVVQSPLQLQLLTDEMAAKGFLIGSDDKDEARLYSKEGEVIAATSDGVEYVLHFGQVFTGTEQEIEIGFANETDGEPGSADSEEPTAESASEVDGESGETKRSRYLFVTAHFDESQLGAKPEEPAKPEKPEGVEISEEGEEAPAETDEVSDAAVAEKPDPAADYQAALAEYERNLETYQNDLKLYEDKRAEGTTKAKELNQRFGAWYYVISAESFENLRLSRADLVKPKEKPAEDGDGAAK